MKRAWTTEEMKLMIEDFSNKRISHMPLQKYCAGVLNVVDFHFLPDYGDQSYGWNVDGSKILFVMDAHGRFLAVEAFNGSRTELDYFQSSWYYQNVADRPSIPRPAANAIPVLQCHLRRCPNPASMYCGNHLRHSTGFGTKCSHSTSKELRR